jgi:hypothetical protein
MVEGLAEGLAEGEVKGEVKALQKGLVEMVKGRFPPLTELAHVTCTPSKRPATT